MNNSIGGQRYCQDCGNILYAEEELLEIPSPGVRGALIYRCRTRDLMGSFCDYYERAQNDDEQENTVYKTDLEAKATALNVNRDIVYDPTLQKRAIKQCHNPKCTNKEVVTFYRVDHTRFELIYCCTKCAKYWKSAQDEKYDINMDGFLADKASDEYKAKYDDDGLSLDD